MLLVISALLLFGGPQGSPAQGPDFDRDIAPLLKKSCGQCHVDASMGKLRLDSAASVLRGGASGPAIVPGHSAESLLIKRVLGADGKQRMPLGGQPLSGAQIDLLRSWIEGGHFEQTGVAQPVSDSPVFAQQIRPLLAQRCYGCHGPGLAQNGLRLDSLAAIRKGGEFGPIVVPHKADQSRLVRRLEAQERPQMPYGGPPLTPDQIALIRQVDRRGSAGAR